MESQLKILNSGFILKTFTHANFPDGKSMHKQNIPRSHRYKGSSLIRDYLFAFWLTLYLIGMPFNTFANRADTEQLL